MKTSISSFEMSQYAQFLQDELKQDVLYLNEYPDKHLAQCWNIVSICFSPGNKDDCYGIEVEIQIDHHTTIVFVSANDLEQRLYGFVRQNGKELSL